MNQLPTTIVKPNNISNFIGTIREFISTHQLHGTITAYSNEVTDGLDVEVIFTDTHLNFDPEFRVECTLYFSWDREEEMHYSIRLANILLSKGVFRNNKAVIISIINEIIKFTQYKSIDLDDLINKVISTDKSKYPHTYRNHSQVTDRAPFADNLSPGAHYILNFIKKYRLVLSRQIVNLIIPELHFYDVENKQPTMLFNFKDGGYSCRFGFIGDIVVHSREHSTGAKIAAAGDRCRTISDVLDTYSEEEIKKFTVEEWQTLIGLVNI